ncbi:FecR family protein [Sphingobacterium paucimobilis]|uniref:FecR protein domain-containing protein n=1 Tax=Sphingobacterium paucimobilis HER1398 TaxID=1346330 RepID=U2J7T8_9SPHI|nr:FecR family protein [Sphingobacterium paucimobilis]ERJ58718.1 hypothetical protein M472_08050 [Sphingobacterium paucimobilis HER1398]
MEEKFYRELVDRYLSKELGEEELQVFFHLLDEGKLAPYLLQAMDEDLADEQDDVLVPKKQLRYIKPLLRGVAALLIASFALATYFYLNTPAKDSIIAEQQSNNTVMPGGNNAILTLANGQQIILNDAINGTVATDESFSVEKEKDGLLVFRSASSSDNVSTNQYHTIETPKGGIYQVVLPDGSQVWLNSASSISFPVHFDGSERRVSIKGEAYFDVVHNKNTPFKVLSKEQEIQVLGTKFNVNAYEDERSTKTTLVDGSVRVKTSGKQLLLRPGYQAINPSDKPIYVQQADIQSVTAWKEGFFQFDRVDVQTLMRQLSRWYDIEIEYRGEIPKDEFVGKIKRSEDINTILEILRYGKVKFELKGRKLIVG